MFAAQSSGAMPLQFAEPFVERYRPKTLDDVVGNIVAIEQLKSIVQFGNMPNLILVVSVEQHHASSFSLLIKI